jgi:hypothetical protein
MRGGQNGAAFVNTGFPRGQETAGGNRRYRLSDKAVIYDLPVQGVRQDDTDDRG